MWRAVNFYQRSVTLTWLPIARCISCRNAAINVVVCRAVSQQAAAADEHQPFLSHFSLTCPLIGISAPKLGYHDSLWWTGRKRPAGASEALSLVWGVITRCAVTLIPSNSNDTSSAAGSAKASQFAIGCRTRRRLNYLGQDRRDK